MLDSGDPLGAEWRFGCNWLGGQFNHHGPHGRRLRSYMTDAPINSQKRGNNVEQDDKEEGYAPTRIGVKR